MHLADTYDDNLGLWEQIAQLGTAYINKRASDAQAGAAIEAARSNVEIQKAQLAAELQTQKNQLMAQQNMLAATTVQSVQSLPFNTQQAIQQAPPGYSPIVVQQPGQAPKVIYEPSSAGLPNWTMYAIAGGLGLLTIFIVVNRRKGRRK
jgi:hypothetical protein